MTHLDDGADLRAVMERSVRDLAAPDHCGPAAIASGRRTRTRRRLAVSLTGVATVAAVAALTLPTLGGSDTTTPEAPMASDPTPAPSPATPSPAPDSPTQVPPAPQGWWDMPSTQMLGHLRQLLPEGVTVVTADTTIEGVEPGEDTAGHGSLSGILSAGTGSGSFQILMWPPDLTTTGLPEPSTTNTGEGSGQGSGVTTATAQSASMQSRIKCRAYHDSCEPITNTDGEQVGRVSATTERGTLLYEVTLLGANGGGLNFTAMNSSGEKPGYEQPSAEVPPLSLDQLLALAEDPVWTGFRP